MNTFDASFRTLIMPLVFDEFQDRPIVDIVIFETASQKEAVKQTEQIIIINAVITIAGQLDMVKIFHKFFRCIFTELFG